MVYHILVPALVRRPGAGLADIHNGIRRLCDLEETLRPAASPMQAEPLKGDGADQFDALCGLPVPQYQLRRPEIDPL